MMYFGVDSAPPPNGTSRACTRQRLLEGKVTRGNAAIPGNAFALLSFVTTLWKAILR